MLLVAPNRSPLPIPKPPISYVKKLLPRCYDKYRDIYSVLVNFRYENGQIQTYETIPMPTAAALKTEIPEIKRAARTDNTGRLFSYQGINFEEHGMYVDPDFLDIFSFPLVRCQRATALSEPFSILITEQLAKKYFGEQEPIGQQLRINEQYDYKVVGVLKNLPSNSTLHFDFLMPMQDFIRQAQNGQESSRGDFNILTYVLLQKDAPAGQVNAKIKSFIGRHYQKYDNTALFLHPARDWYHPADCDYQLHESSNGPGYPAG